MAIILQVFNDLEDALNQIRVKWESISKMDDAPEVGLCIVDMHTAEKVSQTGKTIIIAQTPGGAYGAVVEVIDGVLTVRKEKARISVITPIKED